MSKPLTEVLAGIYVNELSVLKPEEFQHWDNTSDEFRKLHIAAMHQVVRVLDLFNLSVSIDGQGRVSVNRLDVKQASAPSLDHAQAISSGFTGNSCSDCGSMQLVRNGSCEKCNVCGTTTGCS